jgi:glycosyltransferase involved in cell wall biosynthesis
VVEDADRPYAVHRFPGDFCSILSVDKLSGFARLVRGAVRRIGPALVHAVDPQSHMALTLLGRVGLAPAFGVTVHGTELLRYRSESMPRFWMRGAFRRPAGVAVVSNAVRSLLLERSDVDAARVVVAYPGIADHWRERSAADRSAVRASWMTGDDDVVLVTVARRVPEKGQLRVIEALSTLPGPVRRRVACVLIGRGPADHARELVRAAGTGGVRLHLAGALDDDAVIDAVDGADLFIMLSGRTPKRLEGLGLVFLEAGARGVPSLALDTGGVGEAVLDGRTGIVLPEDAPVENVAAAIAGLVDDPAGRRSLGDAAREHALGFTFRRHAAETLNPILEGTGST